MKITTKNRFASTALAALSHLLRTNVLPSSSFCHPVAKGLYISLGDLMDCWVIHICYLPDGLLLSASLYSVSFRRALHSSSSGVTSGGMSPSMTWIFFCKIKLFVSFRLIVKMFIYTGTSHKGTPLGPRVRAHLRKVEKKKTGALEGIQCPRHVSESF